MDEDFSGAKWSRKPITKLSDGTEPPGTLPTPGKILPHAGDYISNEKNYFEIVYMPLQTRIYAYSKKFKPVSAEDVRAQMTLQLPGESAAKGPLPSSFVSRRVRPNRILWQPTSTSGRCKARKPAYPSRWRASRTHGHDAFLSALQHSALYCQGRANGGRPRMPSPGSKTAR